MKENDVAYISEQFGIEKEIVEASIADGTLSTRIQDATKDRIVYKKDEFEAFKSNHESEVTNKYFTDLVEKSKKGDIPTELYKNIKGAAYQQLERDLSKRLGVSEFTDINDLIDKALITSANGKGDEGLIKQVEELKRANLELKELGDNAVKTVEQKYKDMSLTKDKSSLLNSVPFDFSNVAADQLDSAKQKTQTLLKSVFDSEYTLDYNADGKLVVLKGGEVVKNNATLDPVPAQDVFINLAKEYNLKLTSPDTGGQGGKSSGQNNTLFNSVEEYEAYCKENKISTMSAEGIAMLKKSGLKLI